MQQPIQNEQPMSPPPGGGGKKKAWVTVAVIIIIVVLLGLVYWSWSRSQSSPEAEMEAVEELVAPGADDTSSINQALEETEIIENLDQEFQEIDEELEQL